MKRRNIVVLALLLGLLVPAPVSAHVLKTDAGMGAVLHILPDDAPIANVPVSYELTFQEGEGVFSLQNCNCTVTFLKGSNVVSRQTLTAENSAVGKSTYTFSSPAVYTFRVTGAPKSGIPFKPFTLEYPVRVGSGQTNIQPVPPLLWLGIGMATVLILLYAYRKDRQ